MRRLILQTALVLIGASALLAPEAALAGPTGDCNANGHLTGHYSRAELQSALSSMPVTIKEYTNCYDVISRALAATAASGGGGGGGTGSGAGAGTSAGTAAGTTSAALHNKGKTAKASKAHKQGTNSTPSLTSTDPGTVPAESATGHPAASTGSGVPAPLIVILILLGLGALGAGGVAVRRHVVARDGT